LEKKDIELLQKLAEGNPELKKLYDEHMFLEEQVKDFESRKYLSTLEEMEKKNLQKKKLFGKDRIQKILAAHRKASK
jgi:uncharacterized protein YdcH (DUF465 family)